MIWLRGLEGWAGWPACESQLCNCLETLSRFCPVSQPDWPRSGTVHQGWVLMIELANIPCQRVGEPSLTCLRGWLIVGLFGVMESCASSMVCLAKRQLTQLKRHSRTIFNQLYVVVFHRNPIDLRIQNFNMNCSNEWKLNLEKYIPFSKKFHKETWLTPYGKGQLAWR